MATQTEKKQALIRTYLPIAILFLASLASFYRLEAKVNTHILLSEKANVSLVNSIKAVAETNVKQLDAFVELCEEKLTRIKSDMVDLENKGSDPLHDMRIEMASFKADLKNLTVLMEENRKDMTTVKDILMNPVR